MGKIEHCPECGRFTTELALEKNGGFCDRCSDEAVEELMAEEARLDPHGPCGDGSRCR